MQYVKASSNTVETFPYSISLLRKENPNTSFPKSMSDEMLASWGVYPVVEAPDPSYDAATQRIEIDTNPTLVDGVWTRNKSVTAMSEIQLAERTKRLEDNARIERNKKLAETDFYALSDVTMSAEMATYRQALRDITTHSNWPNLENGDWPTKP